MIKKGSVKDKVMEKKFGIKPGSKADKKMESGKFPTFFKKKKK